MESVPNVQELVRNDPLQVPESFLIGNEEEEDKLQSTADKYNPSSEIPIIDLSLLSRGSEEELHKLDKACEEWGFFQVINHGVATEVLQEMKDATAKFFELPLEEKNKIRMPPDDFQGYGRAYAVTQGQTLDWSDALFLSIYPTQYRRPNLWPTAPEGFKETIEAYSSGVKRIRDELLRCLSSTLGMEKDALLNLHQEVIQVLRANYYPPCKMPDKVLGLSPHSDTSTITILMQEDNVTGLQIRKEGEWVPVKPIPNAFVVNVGDVMEIWSNGKYRSIEHRAVTTESKSRISYASFILPHAEVEVEPFGHIVELSGSQKYKKVKYGDYLGSSLKKGKLKGKSHIETAKIGS
ncbi:protein SRG1-like [Pyrus ussuriensis x Pyrus communis]|uniref:Protein SRG1-like n=1 Tax=Pyrus ussuriensis x Pyrus communis TaxID=2448454 RepID=A0A5N5H2G6_9ROSA|nr:protein SRG1-like [Pyrus ussuriensis x Pyrus communis]